MKQLSLRESLGHLLKGQPVDITEATIYNLYHQTTDKPSVAGVLFERPNVSRRNAVDIINSDWTVEYIEPTGYGVVRKSSERIRINPGNYYTWGSRPEFISTGKPVDMADWAYPGWNLSQGDQEGDSTVWFMMHGNLRLNVENKRIIRFYFHLKPHKQRLLEFINRLRERLNYCLIPFDFKCLNTLNDYSRSDSGVLYVQQNHFNSVIFIVSELHTTFSDIIARETPAFTYVLGEGIAFGENPFANKDSFGSFRARVIAQGLQEINHNGKLIIDNQIIDELTTYLINFGFQEHAFYKNPSTLTEYNFPLFNLPVRSRFNLLINSPGNDSIQKLCASYAEQLAFILCKEAIWIDTTTCAWMTVTSNLRTQVIYRMLKSKELSDIKTYLKIVSTSIGHSEPCFENTIRSIRILDEDEPSNDLTVAHEPEVEESTLFNQVGIYLNDFVEIDAVGKNLAKRLIDLFLSKGNLPVNGLGNDYFNPTSTYGLVFYGRFLLKVSNAN